MIKNLTSQQKRKIQKFLLVIIGSIILGLGTGIFLTPYHIISGGLSGVAIIINHFTKFDIDLLVLILTWGFFIVGWIFLGK